MTRAELTNMIDLAKRLIAAGETGVLSTLFSSNGSTYRQIGSMMVSGPPTLAAGGISGGCLEQYVARTGRSLTQDKPAAMLSFDADPEHDDGSKPVLGCGGSIEVLVERLNEQHVEFLESYRAAMTRDDESVATCTIALKDGQIADVSRSLSDRLLSPDSGTPGEGWGGGSASRSRPDGPPLYPSHIVLREGKEKVHREQRVLTHHICPMTRLVIFGAGDDVQSLVSVAHGLDWHVTVVDRRARLATASRFAEADQVIGDDWAAAVEQIHFTSRTAVVLITHSLVDDIEILPLIQDKPMLYVGSLGPDHRREWIINGVQQTTTLDERFIAKLRGPIGLNLGDRTATGIAVSISAEILAELHHRNPTSLSHPKPRTRQTTEHA
jgi:xanthine dehydrogenase accessory factor